ncbi:hypothetical protein Cgig2_014055 [Carnegiea gigantea]|uniref:tRNA pseudouridine synthase n=1 Tax=Carnegiea gigantea TaxID=171969 RepID=A0A9Q1KXC8_9CARY|nr:hypothetical protein Cgig2_014055 [Carnegiea gigantea]
MVTTEEQSRQIMIVQAKPKTKATIALLKPLAVTWFCPRRLMENPGEKLKENEREKQGKEVYHHYAHADLCKDTRWTAKECYAYMYARSWRPVNQFYSDLVNGKSVLSELFGAKNEGNIVESLDEYAPETSQPEDQSGRWARATFKIVVSYHGEYFDGWQKQPGLNTVQGLIERSIGTFVDDKKAQHLKDKGLPVEGMTAVAGRTDKGVTALNQVCSFYTWRKDVKVEDVECAINMAAPGKLRVVSVSQVSRAFHPNFCAKWRRYLYMFPLGEDNQLKQIDKQEKKNICFDMSRERHRKNTAEDNRVEETEGFPHGRDVIDGAKKPTSFSVAKVDLFLRNLEGKLLSYKMFARDTKASRNIGPPTECFLYHARATEAMLPCSSKSEADAVRVMCVELVGNRFLRRMVRVLVATAVREAAAGSEDGILLKLVEATCRRATAPPAPPDGLCLVDVGYSDFNPRRCFIY